MALSEDSRTLLQLLLGRGKNYSDIAGLLGIEESEVRERAHLALTEINGGDPDQDVNLTDYLLGQSDPIGRADVARELSSNEAAAETASDLADQLRLLVPGADLPRINGSGRPAGSSRKPSRPARARRVTPASTGEKTEDSGSGHRLTSSQRRMIAALLLVALLVTVLILALTGTFGGDDDKSPPAADPGAATAVLQPVGDQKGSGTIQLGQAEDQFAARLQFSDLKPTENGESYVLWTVGSVGAFPLNESKVDKDGVLSETITIPSVVFCSIATDVFPTFKLARLDSAERKSVVADTEQAASGKQNSLPKYTGKTVFQGPVAMEQSLKDTIGASCQTAASQSGGASQPSQ